MSKDGGPAFPGERKKMVAGYPTSEREPVQGMTLRDYFAAKALEECLKSRSTNQRAAEEAYIVADAMLAARAKP